MLKDPSRSLQSSYQGWNVTRRIAHFSGWLNRSRQADADGSDYDHTETVNNYYDLCSEYMQSWWNESLHFAPLTPEETIEESIVRHERLMIEQLKLRQGMRVVDVGCGVGAPMRRVARESGAKVTCINNNEQQLEKTKQRNVEEGLDHLAEYVKCSFMDMSAIEANSFDAGYAIESTCHAPDKERAFAEIFRVLKPGALFWGQEMCMTEKFDPDNSRHRTVKNELMLGIALKEIATCSEVNRVLKSVGFQVIEAENKDIKDGPSTPWYKSIRGHRGILLNTLYRMSLVRKAMFGGLRLAEVFRLFPKGSADVARLMDRTGDAYVAGGEMGIFTPLYCFLVRKPE